MVRITAIAILTFAASALAAPQAPGKGGDQILDFKGQPLTGDKKSQFLQLDQQGEAKFKELEATYNADQQKLDQELKAIEEKQDGLLGVPNQQQA